MREFLSDLARDVGDILRGYHGSLAREDIHRKGPRDLVSVADREAEARLVERIRGEFPDDAILGEEGADLPGTSGRRWVVDPLDGTTNFIHGLPFFCVSIGVETEGAMTHGCVFAPVLDELFLAEAGGGATLEVGSGPPAPLAVTAVEDPRAALVATGFADARSSDVVRVDRFERVLNHVGGVRRLGSAALDLCYTARGYYDGFFEWNLNPWDVAGGAVLVREAGGVVTDGRGGDGWLTGRSVVAAGPALAPRLLEILATARACDRISRLQERFRQFVEARGWEAWHSPKNLAMALGVEAAELAEIFQWLRPEEAARGALPEDARRHAGEELSDVLAYTLSMSNALGLDLAEAFHAKMKKNAEKYPAEGPRPAAWGDGRDPAS